MIQGAIAKLAEKENLTADEARGVMGDILGGRATPSQIAGFLVALRMKGETVEEIAGCAQAMRDAATRITPDAPVVVDTCGTGGDKKGSFNISTAAAFVVAGAGFTVAKHGNRSVSSQCGSADVLEVLGVKVDPPTAVVERCLKEIGIAFLFAPAFHPAMRHAMPTRRELGLRTVFNILGPLCNPAGANAQVIGVYSAAQLETVARVLARLGAAQAMVVHSRGHDEVTLYGPTSVVEIVDGKLKKRSLSPRDFGLKQQKGDTLRGGTREENANVIRRVLGGGKGGARDVVVATAALAILVASRAGGRGAKNLKEARAAAERSIDSGIALEKLQKLATLSHVS